MQIFKNIIDWITELKSSRASDVSLYFKRGKISYVICCNSRIKYKKSTNKSKTTKEYNQSINSLSLNSCDFEKIIMIILK